MKYIKSEDNLAGRFTKYLSNILMNKFRNSLLAEINKKLLDQIVRFEGEYQVIMY